MNSSIGAIEFRSIAKGIEVSNELVKKSDVEICYLKSICPGKFLVIVSGDEAAVNEAIKFGVEQAVQYQVDSFILYRIHPQIIKALKHQYGRPEHIGALGVMEVNKVCKGLVALDETLKSSPVHLVKLQIAFGIGGKCVYIVAGELSSIQYGFNMAISKLTEKDMIYQSIIPSVDAQIIENLI